MDVQEQILKLKNLVLDEVNEKKIVEFGSKYLQELRQRWKSQQNDFSKDDINILITLGKKIEKIGVFIEEQEEFPYISTKEEIDEVIGRLHLMLEELVVEEPSKLKILGRVEKEIRELNERKAALPNQELKELKDAINKLNANAPICKKCGSNMLLREGNSCYFWGCSAFPECWGKRWLTKEERNIIS